jgi:hypothetical protein
MWYRRLITRVAACSILYLGALLAQIVTPAYAPGAFSL